MSKSREHVNVNLMPEALSLGSECGAALVQFWHSHIFLSVEQSNCESSTLPLTRHRASYKIFSAHLSTLRKQEQRRK